MSFNRSVRHQQLIDKIVQQYSQDWQASSDQEQIKEYLAANRPDLRKHLLGHLLWVDVEKRSPAEQPGAVE